MAKISSYKELLIWQKGMDIVESVYSISNEFPKDEVFSLTNQMRRSAISIASNIAEGYGRKSTASNIHFVKIARGSLFELETQLIIANRINYIKDEEQYLQLLDNITEESKMISSFINKLEDLK